jgi:hypothetical protein
VFEIAFSQQLQRATPLAGSIFGELFCNFLDKIQAFQISGQTLASKSMCPSYDRRLQSRGCERRFVIDYIQQIVSLH